MPLQRPHHALYRYTGFYSAIYAIIQAVVWLFISIAGILCYYFTCGKDSEPDSFMYCFYLLYFYKDSPVYPKVVNPIFFHFITWIYAIMSLILLAASINIIKVFNNWSVKKDIWRMEHIWVRVMYSLCAVEAIISIIFLMDIRDIKNLNNYVCPEKYLFKQNKIISNNDSSTDTYIDENLTRMPPSLIRAIINKNNYKTTTTDEEIETIVNTDVTLLKNISNRKFIPNTEEFHPDKNHFTTIKNDYNHNSNNKADPEETELQKAFKFGLDSDYSNLVHNYKEFLQHYVPGNISEQRAKKSEHETTDYEDFNATKKIINYGNTKNSNKKQKRVHRIYFEDKDIIFDATICYGQTLVIECPIGFHIKFSEAFYGRVDDNLCLLNSNRKPESCGEVVLEYLISMYNTHTRCVLTVNNKLFKTACTSEPYLYIEYSCSVIDSDITKTICEHPIPIIKCPEKHTYINVKTAYYEPIDSYADESAPRICIAMCHPQILKILKETCDFKQSCYLSESSSEFEEPCSYSYKYLEIKYNCTYREPNIFPVRQICYYCSKWLIVPSVLCVILAIKIGIIWILNIILAMSFNYLGNVSRLYPSLMTTLQPTTQQDNFNNLEE